MGKVINKKNKRPEPYFKSNDIPVTRSQVALLDFATRYATSSMLEDPCAYNVMQEEFQNNPHRVITRQMAAFHSNNGKEHKLIPAQTRGRINATGIRTSMSEISQNKKINRKSSNPSNIQLTRQSNCKKDRKSKLSRRSATRVSRRSNAEVSRYTNYASKRRLKSTHRNRSQLSNKKTAKTLRSSVKNVDVSVRRSKPKLDKVKKCTAFKKPKDRKLRNNDDCNEGNKCPVKSETVKSETVKSETKQPHIQGEMHNGTSWLESIVTLLTGSGLE